MCGSDTKGTKQDKETHGCKEFFVVPQISWSTMGMGRSIMVSFSSATSHCRWYVCHVSCHPDLVSSKHFENIPSGILFHYSYFISLNTSETALEQMKKQQHFALRGSEDYSLVMQHRQILHFWTSEFVFLSKVGHKRIQTFLKYWALNSIHWFQKQPEAAEHIWRSTHLLWCLHIVLGDKCIPKKLAINDLPRAQNIIW